MTDKNQSAHVDEHGAVRKVERITIQQAGPDGKGVLMASFLPLMFEASKTPFSGRDPHS